ncbi:MAG: nucleotide exchange factor GrpE, partial [Planctomycetes bacterium]|nr:nucleotide exchange factor GrpE [Planctomycetota bacterium]
DSLQESPKQRAKRLRKLPDEQLFQLEDLANQALAMVDLARRTQAEFDNFQKRAETQRKQELKYASTSLIRSLLEPVDNLERALVEASKSNDFEALRKGVALTFEQVRSALQRSGVTQISPTDEGFDPEFHEAVMTGVEESKEHNVVLDTFEKGWKLHERVLRPAKVRVNQRS